MRCVGTPLNPNESNEAKDSLGSLIKEIAAKHEPVHISGTDGAAVLLNEDDWNAVQETLHLVSLPGMRESIMEGLRLIVGDL